MAITDGRLEEIKPVNAAKSWMDPFRDCGITLTNLSIRYVPDAWVIAVILTVVVFLMTMVWGNTDVIGATQAWGKGFWILLSLMAQFSFTIIVSFAITASPIVSRGLDRLGSITNPEKPWQAVLLITLFSVVTSYINWALTLVMTAMLVPYVARRNPKTDFRLLVACAYVGGATMWHAGLSGSAPLIVASPDNFLVKSGLLPELIPVSRTMFSYFNFVLIAVTVVVIVAIMILLTPRAHNAITRSRNELDAIISRSEGEKLPANATIAQRLTNWPGWNILCGIACLFFILYSFKTAGLKAWTINMYNWVFLTLALFVTWRPTVFLQGCRAGVTGAWGILVQFPFYGGIFGLVSYTGLGSFLTNVFTSISTRETFLPLIYWYSGILSYFVPSGGSKFAIEAPYMIGAAKSFGISSASVTLIYAWGDMLTHLIQPFWAIPILGITKTSFGEIAGFCAVVFIVYAIVLTGVVCLAPLGL